MLHRSWRSIIPGALQALIVASVVYWISKKFSFFGLDIKLGSELYISLPLFLLLLLVFLARPVSLLFDSRHEVTCHHLRSVQGLLSLNKQFIEIPYEEVLGVRASQTLVERILGVGSILAWTATADTPDLVMEGIKNPELYARYIGGKVNEANIQKN